MNIQQFANASVSPRSIAWLIRLDEWDRFEKIIKYNCAMLGGYFNVLIPLTDQDTISEEYQHFLVDYDPDFIVLAPGMTSIQPETFSARLHPFATIQWGFISRIAILDPWGGGSGISATMGLIVFAQKDSPPINTVIAVADDARPDISQLALVACGDVEPREPMWNEMDDDIGLDATGYRENFLMNLLNPGQNLDSVRTHIKDESEIVLAPDRYQLTSLISEEHQFPLSDAVKILGTCCRLQHYPKVYRSFIGLTAMYNKTGTPRRTFGHRGQDTPSMVILVSDDFGLNEAILFWNLRASGFYVSWVQFFELEKNKDAIAKWLESDYGGVFYSIITGKGLDIVFSCQNDFIPRLQVTIENLQHKRKESLPKWRVVPHDYLVFYDYTRPSIAEGRVVVAKDGSQYSFIPKLPQENSSGEYTVTLGWNGLMVPPNSILVHDRISADSITDLASFRYAKARLSSPVPRFRITKDRYLKVQINSEQPVEFNKPAPEEIVETLFSCGGFSRVERSSAAKYHLSFIHRTGSFEEAIHYLANSSYRELLTLLSDNSNRNRPGWILDDPSKRRALHHLHLRQVLGKVTPPETTEYFKTASDELPEEALNLLKKNLLERGFLLKCSSCSFNSWYPAEHVGQTFECARCFQAQVYESNPLWLYKLPEVIFQGFEDNMQVPLLTLGYLKHMSHHSFEWVLDSNIYWIENGKELHRNVDILCICDGKLYVGEAKSNDEIKADQFSFYEEVCRRVAIDGIVFATSELKWSQGTEHRIKQLKTWFDGQVLVLTKTDLYLGF